MRKTFLLKIDVWKSIVNVDIMSFCFLFANVQLFKLPVEHQKNFIKKIITKKDILCSVELGKILQPEL